jgi:hypothetical protein
MARKKDSNGDGFTPGGEFINEVTKVRNLHATSRRIRSQEKRDKAEHIAFVIAHKDYIETRRATAKSERQQRNEAKRREKELIRSTARRLAH